MLYTPYEIIKWWLPIVSAFGMVIAAYRSAARSVKTFFDTLLHNHLSHIEANTAQSTVLLEQVCFNQKTSVAEAITLARHVSDVAEALRMSTEEHACTLALALKENNTAQAATCKECLTGIELLKDRTRDA